MKQLALILLFALTASAQIFVFPPSGGGAATGVAPYSATFSAQATRTITAATHGQGPKPAVLYCERTSDGVRTYGWADTNSSGDITIVPAAGAAYTGYCQIAAGSGIQGEKGDTGDTGPAGAQGAQGVQGIQGVQGPAGPVGSAVGAAFTAQTSVTITHNWNTLYYGTECADAGGVKMEPSLTTKGVNSVVFAFDPAASGTCLVTTGGGGGGDSMTYPGAGVPKSTGSTWDTSYAVGTAANNLVQLTAAAKLPAVDGSLLTNLPSGGTIYTSTGITGAGTSGDPIRMDSSGGGASQVLYSASLTGWATMTAAGGATPCVQKNITATGAVSGESVAPIIPSTLPIGLSARVDSASDLLVVTLCNHLGTTVTVADGLTFGGRIVRGF